MTDVAHLVRRFVGMLSRRPPDPGDEAWAAKQLGAAEQALWVRMIDADRRHSITVARRFVARRPGASRAEIAGALLHDIGKVESDLGVIGRVVATVVGSRTTRLRRYHDHERLGARLLAEAGSAPETVELVGGRGPAAPALRDADDV